MTQHGQAYLNQLGSPCQLQHCFQLRFPFGLVAASQKHSQVIDKPSDRLLLPSLESQASAASAPALTFVPGSRSTCSPQKTYWKLLALLGLHLQRSFHSLTLDTCLTCNTNIAPEKNLNWPPVQSQLPALQGSRYQTWLLFFRMPVPPSAHHMKPNESTFILNQREQGNTGMTTWSLTCIFLSLKQHLTEPFPLTCITVTEPFLTSRVPSHQVMPQAGQKPLSCMQDQSCT